MSPDRFDRTYAVKGRRYRVRLVSPPDTKEAGAPSAGSTLVMSLSRRGLWSALMIVADPAHLRIFLLTGELPLASGAIPDFPGAPLNQIMGSLEDAGAKAKIAYKGTLVEAGGQEEENLVNVCTAGLPPLVLVSAGNFTLPVRSGVPAGVVPERKVVPQYMEWQPGDCMILYTDWTNPGEKLDLRAFHESVKTGALPETDRGMIVSILYEA